MNTKYYDTPTVVSMEDWGDDDAALWQAEARYKDQKACASSRDSEVANQTALERVRGKVLANENAGGLFHRTPETDHDFAEVE
jgi:hypothetical protein